MDTDFIAAIVAVVIAAILGWVERLAKNAKATKAGSAHAVSATKSRKPAASVPRKVSAPKAPRVDVVSDERQASSIVIGSEEGVRVTDDIQEDVAAAPVHQPRLKPLDAEGLRNAVLWGEILQRKF